MKWRKWLGRAVLTGMLACSTFSVSYAEIVPIEAEGEAIIGDSPDENLGVARERARSDAMRNAADKAGVYVRSSTVVQNGMLASDEVRTISSKVLKLLTEPSYGMEPIGGQAIRISCHLKANIDTENLGIDKILADESMFKQNVELQNKIQQLEQDNIRLRSQYVTASAADRAKINEDIKKNEQKFMTDQLLDKCWNLISDKKYTEALALANSVLTMDPTNATAYYYKGYSTLGLGNSKDALTALTLSIQMDPNMTYAYIMRGGIYFFAKEKEKSLQDYSKVVHLNPQWALAYLCRGNLHADMKNKELALRDYATAIQLAPKNPDMYTARGMLLKKMGDKVGSDADLQMAQILRANR